jgi:hypothetical protein
MRTAPCQSLASVLLAALLAQGCAGLSSLVDRATGEDVNRAVRASGLPATATVVAIWDTGTRVNDDPVVGFRLAVEAPGRDGWEAATRALVSILAIPRIQPGAVLAVRYDPADPQRVAIEDLSARSLSAAAGAPPDPE